MLASGTAAELYRRGRRLDRLSAPPRLAWVRRHEPDRWAAAARLSMIADWIVFRLTGTLVTEASIGSTSGLFDLGLRAWSPEIMTLCELKPCLFPEVVEAGMIAPPGVGSGGPADGPAPRGRRWRPAAWTRRSAWPVRGERFLAISRSPAGASWKQSPSQRIRPPWNRPDGCARSAMSSRASGWWRGSASTPDPRCAGSGIRQGVRDQGVRDQGVRAAAGRPAGYTWLEQLRRRRCRPEHAASPRDWPRPTPGPGRTGSRPSRPGRRPGRARRRGPSRRPPPTRPA